MEQRCRQFSLSEILSATQNFDEEWVIGQGGFGKVYLGILADEPDGSKTSVAIKCLGSRSAQGQTEFLAEIEMLSKVRHCHVVSLIGYCNDRDEMILVYEFMSHGTLADHLYEPGEDPLSWLQRIKICLGAARGLDHLHSGTSTVLAIIHCDVKSSNILLDHNYAAKVSDFGLSKNAPINQTITYVSTAVKGTFGYMDPEFFQTGRLTRKSDVYSFGVVLLEVLCGRCAVDTSLEEEQWSLSGWALECIKEGKLEKIIDSNMKGQISISCLKEFADIVVQCLQRCPKDRPTMAEVVANLEHVLKLQEKTEDSAILDLRNPFVRNIQNIFFPTSVNGDASSSRKNLTSYSIVSGQNREDIINAIKLRLQRRKLVRGIHKMKNKDWSGLFG